jgi:hypothetical protein
MSTAAISVDQDLLGTHIEEFGAIGETPGGHVPVPLRRRLATGP